MDELTPNRIWNFIDAWDENNIEEWERTRALGYIVGRYGNSDPKKFPKTAQKFWSFPWDKKSKNISAEQILKQHAEMKRQREEIEKRNAGRTGNIG